MPSSRHISELYLRPGASSSSPSFSMPHHRRELAAGDHFSFSNNSIPGIDPDTECSFGIELSAWSERVEGGGHTFGACARWHHCNNCGSPGLAAEKDCKSQVNAVLPATRPSSPKQFSPATRVQAIAKYRKEMQDLVKDMPEFAYELSLRDLAELPMTVKAVQESQAKESLPKSKLRREEEEKVVKKGGRRGSRCESKGNGGLLLKMFFPVSLGGKKRSGRSSDGSSKSGGSSKVSLKPPSKVSPKPLSMNEGKARGEKSVKAEWSEKKQLGELSRSCSRGKSGCYPLFHNNRSKNRGV